MSDLTWEALSEQAVAGAGVVYFLALLAYLVEWAALRSVQSADVAAEARTSGVDSGDVLTEQGPGDAASEERSRLAEASGRLGLLLLGLAAVIHLVCLVARGMAADPNRVPWGNMYEFTLAGTFFVTLIFLVLYRRFQLAWLGPVVAFFAVALLMIAVIWLYGPVSPLREALNSPWLVIHVVSAAIAAGAFTVGGMTSALYLIKDRRGAVSTGYLARVPDKERLDLISYRVHAFAFPVWTFAVLITGPIWAHQAWSSYWNWDPKEVWALITWVVYAAYLHARATAGWRGRKAAWLALVGVATLLFNFIGINYFSTSSQHSYAAPAPSSVVEVTTYSGSSL